PAQPRLRGPQPQASAHPQDDLAPASRIGDSGRIADQAGRPSQDGLKSGSDPRKARTRKNQGLTPAMHIWVDADACPAVIKDILYRAAERAKIPLTLVANKLLRAPPSPYIRALQVPRGIDVADSHIVRELAPGDLVVTADIPLAADVIAKGGHALNPRGEFYSPENIQERLALRNYLDELRGTGERTGGPAALDNTDRKRFAVKMWTGWPTFPMVFVKGVLVGGASDLAKLIESGELPRKR